MFKYFLIGFESVWEMSLFRYVSILLIGVMILLCLRRLSVVWKSGGSFFAPFHIAKGRFFIHNAYVFRKRIIPLNNIKKIEVHFIPSVKLNGARYFLSIQQKNGKALAFFFGQSKENDKIVRNLKNETKKYNIKIRILES